MNAQEYQYCMFRELTISVSTGLELAVWRVFGEELRHTAEELSQTRVMERMGASSSSVIGLRDFTE